MSIKFGVTTSEINCLEIKLINIPDHTLPSDSLILFEETPDVEATATGEAQAFELKILSHSLQSITII